MSKHQHHHPHSFDPKNEAEYLKGHSHAKGDHSHRPIIMFDKNGIPKVVDHEHDHTTDADYQDDYMKAVAAYKKTFPDKERQMNETPDPAVREMVRRMDDLGIDSVFDRFDAQKPQCNFGIAGICCKNCLMGPCRITPKSAEGRLRRGRGLDRRAQPLPHGRGRRRPARDARPGSHFEFNVGGGRQARRADRGGIQN